MRLTQALACGERLRDDGVVGASHEIGSYDGRANVRCETTHPGVMSAMLEIYEEESIVGYKTKLIVVMSAEDV